jgi:hypothetical protein
MIGDIPWGIGYGSEEFGLYLWMTAILDLVSMWANMEYQAGNFFKFCSEQYG